MGDDMRPQRIFTSSQEGRKGSKEDQKWSGIGKRTEWRSKRFKTPEDEENRRMWRKAIENPQAL